MNFLWIILLGLLLSAQKCDEQKKSSESGAEEAEEAVEVMPTDIDTILTENQTDDSIITGPFSYVFVAVSEELIEHPGFMLVYSEAHEQSFWVGYELTRERTQGSFPRTDRFVKDPKVSTGSATNKDYASSGYDRGHLAPAADMAWSEESMKASFYFSNMSPQLPGFNRGVWKRLEELVRDWAKSHDHIYVVTGPVLTSADLPTIGENAVAVPRYYYKVIIDYAGPEWRGIGFVLENASSSLPLHSFAVSIDSVQRLTGLDFFHFLPDSIEQVLETENCFSCW